VPRQTTLLRPPGAVPRAAVAIAALTAVATLLLAGTSAAETTTRSTHPHAGSTTSTTTPATTTTAGPPPAAPGTPPWTVVSTDPAGVAVEQRTMTVASGDRVTLIRFDAGHVVFDLHIGTTDPPVNLATIPADRGPAIAADESPFLLAAFNGGFKIRDGPGGVVQQGQVIAPLADGKASFVIDVNGTAHVGVWGSGLPAPGEQVSSVRQNLAPLITGGVPNPTVGLPADWGATLTSSKVVPRTAAGEDAQGDIIFAGGMSVVPADLSTALLDSGAVNAMQLDINPEWVQLDAAAAEGAPLVAQIPGQNRPAGQYVAGWTRDFIAVMGPFVVPPLKPR